MTEATTRTPGTRRHRDECAETQDKDSDPDHCVSCCAEYVAEIEADCDHWKAAQWSALQRGDRLLLKLDKARSAAPDMLEALRSLLANIDSGEFSLIYHDHGETMPGNLDALRAALANTKETP